MNQRRTKSDNQTRGARRKAADAGRKPPVQSDDLAGFSELARRTQEPPISWLMNMTLARPNLISLAAGFTDDASLPVAETEALLREILSSKKEAQKTLQYGSTVGDPVLRRLTGERLREQDGTSSDPEADLYRPERLTITHGSQQLLYLVTECLCDPGDIVLLEDPTYFVYLGITESRGLTCRGIPLQPDGIDLAALEQTLERLKREGGLSRVKMLYLVSYFQNPSGVTTSFQKKARALELLKHYERFAGHPIYLLEDAAYRDLRFGGEDIPSALVAKGAGDRVIYAGTYSKPFATGIRVGYGVLPEPVLRMVARLKGNHDFGTSNLLQQILARALGSCRYREHVALLQKRYAGKAAVMVNAIRESFPGKVEWQPPAGGLYVWAKAPRRVKTGPRSKLFKRVLERDVLYVPGELCYAQDETRPASQNEMRLSFGNANEKDIQIGISRLGEIFREMVN